MSTRAKLSSLSLIAVFATACESEHAVQQSLEQANLEKAIYCMELLEIELNVEAAGDECFAEGYIQHSRHVPDGKEGVISHFTRRAEEFPESTISIKRASADGDLVWMHLHSVKTPGTRGNAVMHIFRMKDGKFVEHWGVGMPVPEESLHGNSMF